MIKKTDKKNIDLFYALALKEGQGLGTAYEYLVKSHLIGGFFEKIPNPKEILIAGLPEKYGYGLDLLLYADSYGCNIDIIDERDEAVENLNYILEDLKGSRVITADNIRIKKVKCYEEAEFDKYYDLGFSSAVLQRFNEGSRLNYLEILKKKVKYLVLFVPNKGNKSHQRLTCLNSFYIDDLVRYTKRPDTDRLILDSGVIDLPPFPPGIKASAKAGKLMKNRAMMRILGRFLSAWAGIEPLFPKAIKNKFAHIAYLISVSKNESNCRDN